MSKYILIIHVFRCGEYVEDNHLNLAIVGHVDSGKSTLVG